VIEASPPGLPNRIRRCTSSTPSSSARGVSASRGTTVTRPGFTPGSSCGSGPDPTRARSDSPHERRNPRIKSRAAVRRLYPGGMPCPACGTPAPDGARFCPSCGRALVVRQDERRVATVLFADLVGFTTYSEGADPEHVKQLVDRCFQRLAKECFRFGGQVAQSGGELV